MNLAGTLISASTVLAGTFLLVGIKRRWRWVIDPPDFLWPNHPLSLIKRLLGSEGCAVFALHLGILLIEFGSVLLIAALIAT